MLNDWDNNVDNRIAIIGQSCRFPGANNLDEFWDLLKEGRSSIRPFPTEREQKCHSGYINSIQAGFLTCPVDEFDAQFFGISPREAPLIDPQQRLLLELTWESLEDSGISPQDLRGTKTGVFVGIWQGDYDRLLHTGTRTASDLFHRYLGNAFSATTSRISFCLGFHGPAVALESGCASSMGALHLACESIRRGESNVAICGGVNLILIGANPFTGGAIDEDDDSIVLSKDFKCKTFDESANGFVRAEACGVLVLKPYVKAKTDNDKILAVIRGSAMNNDGTGVSFGTPNADAQEYVYRDALINAKVQPEEITLVEAHGTGTPVGDPIEMDAITRVYSKNRKTPIYVSSVKTNIGHCEAASGMASVFKALLCLQHKMIPPHINLQKLNPRINLDSIPAIIPQELTPWNSTPRICAVSSFSMSATNVHVIMEEATSNYCPVISTPNVAYPYVVTLSAKTKEALKSLKLSYIAFLEATPEIQLYDIAYATNVGRAHHTYRTALTASSTSEVVENIKSENWIHEKASAEKKGVVFLFPGQGCQFFGMTEELAEKFPIFRKALEKGDKIFKKLLEVSLFDVLWKNPEYLNRALYCQPAIVAVECALLNLWVSFGVSPSVVLGHSLGEFSAAVATGFFRFEEAMEIIIYRSLLVNNNIKAAGAMLVVSRDLAQVQNIIDRFTISSNKKYWIDVAAVNAEDEIVLSGQEEAIEEFRKYCLGLSISTTIIPSSQAFHSRDMDELLDKYGKKLNEILSTNHPNHSCKFLSATDAKFITGGLDVGYWQRHLRNSVQFSKAFALLRDEYKVFVEVGPQTILSSLAMRNHPSPETCIFCPLIRIHETNSSTFLKAVSKLHVNGNDINWRAMTPKKINHVNLPLYPFQRESYWFVSDEETESVKLHPLLGHEIQTPNPGKIYSNVLRTSDLNYLNDHKVAGIAIYPAAAYIETFLAAGRDILQGGGTLKYPLVVKDFNIDGALDLQKPVTIQATAEQQEIVETNTIQYKINLHRKMANCGEFKRIASGVYIPSSSFAAFEALNIENIKSNLGTHMDSLDHLYANIEKRGIEFGPKFRSIVSAWSSGTGDLLAEVKNITQVQQQDYVCHPIILDAMIQAFAMRTHLVPSNVNNLSDKEFSLPISVKTITWFPGSFKSLYVYSQSESNFVILLNENGQRLVILEEIELITTTKQNFLRAMQTFSPITFKFSYEQWRLISRVGDDKSNVVKYLKCIDFNSEDFLQKVNKKTSRYKYNPDAFTAGDKYFMKALYVIIQMCKWPFQLGSILKPSDWSSEFPSEVPSQLANLFMLYLKDEFLEQLNDETYKVVKLLPPFEECYQTAEYLMEKTYDGDPDKKEFEALLKRWGRKFLEEGLLVFQGKLTPIEYHFPSDSSKLGAIEFYTKNYSMICCTVVAVEVIGETLKEITEANHALRILEVGGGGGIGTEILLTKLKEMGLKFEYVFTDIAKLLVENSKKKFGDEIKYGIFDIDQDPLSQGFYPDAFDIVFAVEVFHATQDLGQTLRNLRKVLRIGGKIIFCETVKPTNIGTFPFGLLKSFWRFEDFRKERYLPYASEVEWKELLKSNGFDGIDGIPTMYDVSCIVGTKVDKNKIISTKTAPCNRWIIFDDKTSLATNIANMIAEQNRELEIIDPTKINSRKQVMEILMRNKEIGNLEGIIFFCTQNEDYNVVDKEYKRIRYSEKLLLILQGYIDIHTKHYSVKPKIIIVTRGAFGIQDDDVNNPTKITLWGLIRSFRNENDYAPTVAVDFGKEETEYEKDQLFMHLWSNDLEDVAAYRHNRLYVQRYIEKRPKMRKTPLTNSERYRFINPPSGLFTDMAIGPDIIRDIPKYHIEINVKAVALNFKDIFCILKPEGFHIPEKFLEAVGLDVAGIVSRVGEDVTKFKKGDEVFGLVATGGLASHAVLQEKLLLLKPNNISFAEAAGIPTAYLTAYYCLVHLADIQPHHSVLIHVASGGVGLAAVNIVKAMGKEIYATAGSKRKRAYLRSIGIKYIYNSRNIEFSQLILNDTKGVGVDIVLNSLTGPGFIDASLAATSSGGRFIEIAKLNIWEVKEMNEKRPDVKYDIMNMLDVQTEEDQKFESTVQRIEAEVQKGTYGALPVKCFPLEEIQSAFNYFQEAKQIGKVVLKMPKTELNSESGKLAHISQPFDAQGSYIITGGLGGIGLEVTKWMASKGAKHIILVGRSAPNASVQKVLEGTHDKCNIYVFSMDVGVLENCERLFEFFTKESFLFPTVRGIFHAAGVLQDELFETQTWSNFENTMKPKIIGAWNFHYLTSGIRLDYFVLFSSGGALFGSVGQSPHVVANRYLDAFAHYRHLLGLPALSINWGLWLNVGVGAGIANELENKIGLTGFPPSVGIQGLEQMLIEPEPQVGFILLKDWRIFKKLFPQGHYLDEIVQTGPEEDPFAKFDVMIQDIKNSAPEERAEKTAIVIECIIKETLKLPLNEKIDHDQNFNELGVDSLMAMEMKGRLQKILGGRTMPISALQENRTIRKLSQYVANMLDAEEHPAIPLTEMMSADTNLPDEIQAQEISCIEKSSWRGILVTGATGHLGVHMLPEIQRTRPDIKIYCLVRAKTEAEAHNRIKEELEYFEITSQVDIDKIVAVAGDITLDKFGLEDENYDKLAEEIDAVLHSAIRANHIENYYDGSKNDIRTVNVLGFLNILKFSTTYLTKHVMYTSAVLAVTELEADGSVPERFLGLDSYTKVDNGYLQSKCIAEALLEQAIERGIPSTVFRIPALSTSTQNGIPTRSVNHGWNLFMAGTRIRKFPEVDMGVGLPMYPVDVAAKICIGIFLKDDSEEGVYNLLPDKHFSNEKFKEVAAECGFDFEFVPFEEWRQEIFEVLNDSELGIFSSLYTTNEKNTSKLYDMHKGAGLILQNTESNLKPSLLKVRRNFPEYEHVNEYSLVDIFRLQFGAHVRKQKTTRSLK